MNPQVPRLRLQSDVTDAGVTSTFRRDAATLKESPKILQHRPIIKDFSNHRNYRLKPTQNIDNYR